MSKRETAIALAVASSVLSSIGWVFQGAAVGALDPLSVAAIQGILSGVVYFVYLRPFRARIPTESLRRHARELLIFILLRAVFGAILLNYALEVSGSIKVMFFTKLEPYFILFWMWLIQNKTIGRYHLALLLVHIAGAVLLSVGNDLQFGAAQFGDLLLVLAMGMLSFSQLYVSKLSQEVGPTHLNGLSSLASGLLLLLPALVISPVTVWNPLQIGWAYVLIVVLLFNVISMTMWYAALRYLEAWLVSAVRAVGPVFAAPVAWLLFGEMLTSVQIVGALIVLVTSAILAKDQRRRESKIS